VRVNVDELGADLLTVVGHKFGAPKGVAALYIRSGVHLAPYLHGGGQVRVDARQIWLQPFECLADATILLVGGFSCGLPMRRIG